MPLNCVCLINLQNSGRYYLKKQDPSLCMHHLLDFLVFHCCLNNKVFQKDSQKKIKFKALGKQFLSDRKTK